jgi:hypothetical protein
MQLYPLGRVAKRKAGRLARQVFPGLAALVALATLALAAVPGAGSAATHRETVTFDETQLTFSRVHGYDLVSLEGARWLRDAGKPLLPAVPVRIGLPAGGRVLGVSAVASESLEIAGAFSILPAQPPQPLSAPRRAELVPPDVSVYSSGEIYPRQMIELAGTGTVAGTTICEILVYPLRYLPARGTLVLHTSIEIVVEYQETAIFSAGGASREMRALAERLVSSQAGPWSKARHTLADTSPLGGGEVTYLIVTGDALKEAFEPLRVWKMRKGLRSEIVTVETIADSYVGTDLQEKIRNCIKQFHAVSGTDWVLLGGDTDVVPARQAYVALSDKPYIPCDLYYSDLDGTWNADDDPLWGEHPSDDIDMYADVFVGRAPVSSPAEAAAFVTKVLTYEGAYQLPTDYQLKMLFLGEVLWGDPDNPSDPDYTDGGVAKNLVASLYVPETFTVEKLYQSAGSLLKADALARLDEGVGIVNVCCHGTYGSISAVDDALDKAEFLALTSDSRYGVMYSASCFGGGFDQINGCIGENWVLSELGGGYYIGNSRYGWDTPGEPGDGPSDYYDQSFFESVFITGFEQVGKAHADAKHEFVGESRVDSYMRYLQYGLNLLGDPETAIWTEAPVAIEVTHAPAIGLEPVTYVVGVAREGSPVQGARVCVWKSDDVYAVGETGPDGNVGLIVDAWSAGTLLVTVTAAGAVPYLGEAVVEECVSVPDGEGPGGFKLSIAPNPFRYSVSVAVETGEGSPTVEVYDVKGRRVAAPELRRIADGRYDAVWSGEDSSGRRCSPGIYFVRVASGTEDHDHKLILLK